MTEPVTRLRILIAIALVGAIGERICAESPPGRVTFTTFGDESVQASSHESEIESVWTAPLPPLEIELHEHGGAYLYEPLDVTQTLYHPPGAHARFLRRPGDWQEPQPYSWPYDYLGSHPIPWDRHWSWFGRSGAQWEPRLVVYGSYEVFGVALENARRRRDGIGHQLIVDADLAWTGTERFHVQFRPLGGKNSGGSFFNFAAPEGYDDNSEGEPQRWWFEGELESIFGGLTDVASGQLDLNLTLGKFPLVLQNALLMNDEVTGLVLGKNNLLVPPFSNLNLQAFYLLDDVDTPAGGSPHLLGAQAIADYRQAFLEATWLHLFDNERTGGSQSYLALAGTQFFGPLSVAARAMFRSGGRGGELFVIETSHSRRPNGWFKHHAGIELAVTYVNLFRATDGWQPAAGGNFDRLRNVFVLNPLLQIAAGRRAAETTGVAVGSQLFRHHEDESFIPELAVERIGSETVWGLGLQYERRLAAWIYLNLRGVKTWSDDPAFVREGVFASTFLLF